VFFLLRGIFERSKASRLHPSALLDERAEFRWSFGDYDPVRDHGRIDAALNNDFPRSDELIVSAITHRVEHLRLEADGVVLER